MKHSVPYSLVQIYVAQIPVHTIHRLHEHVLHYYRFNKTWGKISSDFSKDFRQIRNIIIKDAFMHMQFVHTCIFHIAVFLELTVVKHLPAKQ